MVRTAKNVVYMLDFVPTKRKCHMVYFRDLVSDKLYGANSKIYVKETEAQDTITWVDRDNIFIKTKQYYLIGSAIIEADKLQKGNGAT